MGLVSLRTILRRGAEAVDAVAVEEPLEIRVDGDAVATTMRTPGADADLALGFLFAEGLIGGARDVCAIAHCGRPGEDGYGNVLDVRSAAGTRIDPGRILEGRRFVQPTSACGVCGRLAVDGLVRRIAPVDAARRVPPARVIEAIEALARAQPGFARSGGLHAAALVAADGTVLAAAEDVGRHNAVDKAVGALVRQGRLGAGAAGEPPAVLAVSGRAGFEIVQKAAAAGVPVVASVSAPTSLAADLAEAAGVALAGFVRGGGMNIYANAWRLAPAAGA
jgi:FdhD protein